jgi:hypothetical protein
MAIRKTASKKTTVVSKAKVAPKKTAAPKKVTATAKKVTVAAKKTSPKKKKEVKVGDCYECSVCGLEVSVENACDCAGPCDLICCGEPMEMI